jgi:hypothetical protein
VIARFQEALVALATDRALRRRFAREPDAALASFALDPRARAALLAIPFDALERYASSLENKRWGEVARVVPRTLKIAPSLRRSYCTWLGGHPAPAEDHVQSPGVSEALRALPALRAALSNDGEAVYAAGLYEYEALAAASRTDGAPRTLASRFALHDIARALDGGTIPIDPDLAPHAYRFERARILRRAR